MLVAVAIGIVGGVSALAEGRTWNGVFWLAVSLGLVGLWLRRKRDAHLGRAATPFLRVQAYLFFGGGVLVGIGVLVLAAVGSEPFAYGVLGVVCIAINGHILARMTRYLLDEREGLKEKPTEL